MEIGLLALRLILAVILFAHAAQKLFGWFSGPGLDGAARGFEALGQRPGKPMALLAGTLELVGAALLAFGLLTPLGVVIAAAVMFVAAAATTAAKGTIWNAAGGGEYPLTLAAFALAIGFTGPGAWSLDSSMDAGWVPDTATDAAILGAGAVTVALIAALPPVLRMRSSTGKTDHEPAAHPDPTTTVTEGGR